MGIRGRSGIRRYGRGSARAHHWSLADRRQRITHRRLCREPLLPRTASAVGVGDRARRRERAHRLRCGGVLCHARQGRPARGGGGWAVTRSRLGQAHARGERHRGCTRYEPAGAGSRGQSRHCTPADSADPTSVGVSCGQTRTRADRRANPCARRRREDLRRVGVPDLPRKRVSQAADQRTAHRRRRHPEPDRVQRHQARAGGTSRRNKEPVRLTEARACTTAAFA